jgi:hypothetical protein
MLHLGNPCSSQEGACVRMMDLQWSHLAIHFLCILGQVKWMESTLKAMDMNENMAVNR